MTSVQGALCLTPDLPDGEPQWSRGANLENLVRLTADSCATSAAAIVVFVDGVPYVRAAIGFDGWDLDRLADRCRDIIARRDLVVADEHPIDAGKEPFAAGVPLFAQNGVVVGVLYVLGAHPGAFASAQASLLFQLGRVASDLLRHDCPEIDDAADSELRQQLERSRHQAESLAKFKSLFDRASTLTRIGTWERDLETQEIVWSAGMFDIYEIEDGRIPNVDALFAMFPPGTRETLEQLPYSVAEDGGHRSLETAMVTAKGRPRWVRLTSSIERQEGRADRLFGILQDISEQKAMWDRLRCLAETDILTGMANRSVVQKAIEVAATVRDREPLTLVLIDMDGFKHVNDTFGHQVGDECLKRIAERIRQACASTDLVGRMGGDEFALLIRSSDRKIIEGRISRILRELRRPVRWRGKSFQL
ncbi:GGDEF domain-containing protein, partial [Salmonella enterica]|nr:GGDEF domain-containing protein [Salmonella enterica]